MGIDRVLIHTTFFDILPPPNGQLHIANVALGGAHKRPGPSAIAGGAHTPPGQKKIIGVYNDLLNNKMSKQFLDSCPCRNY